MAITLLHDLLHHPDRPDDDRIAFIDADRSLTYGDLRATVEALAAAFADALEVAPGERIALVLPNCLEFPVAYLAALRAGAVIVPLNPLLAPAELRDIFTECAPQIVITIPQLLDSARAAAGEDSSVRSYVVTGSPSAGATTSPASITGITTHTPVVAFEELLRHPGERPATGAVGGDPAALGILLYTSGTTGRPKGIMLSQTNLLSNVRSLRAVHAWQEHEVFLTILPLFHGYAATAMMLLALRLGATAILESRFVPPRVFEKIAEHRVTFFAGVPAMYALMLKNCDPAIDTSSCRVWISGAAALPVPLFEAFRERFGVDIVEGYGPQECSPVVSVNPMLGPVRPGTVGPPLPDVEVRIVDKDGKPVDDGEDGEIQVRGAGVMLGYFDKPEDTALVLRDGWYATGDAGRLDDAGFLVITGRIKEMIIVKGENVYPAEVEAALLTHADVDDVAVKGVPDAVRGEKVVAFVVRREGSTIDAKRLIDHCTPLLAGFKLARDIRFIDAVPRNLSGKILRRALPDE